MTLLNKEQHEYLVSIVKGRSNIDVTALMNEKYSLCLRVRQIEAYKKNHNLSSGLTGRFEKGHVPVNKGKKMSAEFIAKTKQTQFKKGNTPYNRAVVGTKRITSDGYVKIKIAEPNIWKQYHRLVWEENNGKIPEGKMITFVDGNPLNCDIDNLVMIDQQINSLLNKLHVKERSKDLVNIAADIVAIKNKVKEVKR